MRRYLNINPFSEQNDTKKPWLCLNIYIRNGMGENVATEINSN